MSKKPLDDDEVGLLRTSMSRRFEKWWSEEDRGFGHKDVAEEAFGEGFTVGLMKDVIRTRRLFDELMARAQRIYGKAMEKQQSKLDKARKELRKMRRDLKALQVGRNPR